MEEAELAVSRAPDANFLQGDKNSGRVAPQTEEGPDLKLKVPTYCHEGKDGQRPKTPEAKNDLASDGCSTACSLGHGKASSVSDSSRLTGRTEASTSEPVAQTLKREAKDADAVSAEEDLDNKTLLGSRTDASEPQDSALAVESDGGDSSGRGTPDDATAGRKLRGGSPTLSRPESSGTGETSSPLENLGNSLSSPDSACQLDGEGLKGTTQQHIVDLFMQFVKQCQEPAPGEAQGETDLHAISSADVAGGRLWRSAVQRDDDGSCDGNREALSLLSAAAEGLSSSKRKEVEALALHSRGVEAGSRTRGPGAEVRPVQCTDTAERSASPQTRKVNSANGDLPSGPRAGLVSDPRSAEDEDFCGSKAGLTREEADTWSGPEVGRLTGEASELDLRALSEYLFRAGALDVDPQESGSGDPFAKGFSPRRQRLDFDSAGTPQAPRPRSASLEDSASLELDKSAQDALLSSLVSRFPNLQQQLLAKEESHEDEAPGDALANNPTYRQLVGHKAQMHSAFPLLDRDARMRPEECPGPRGRGIQALGKRRRGVEGACSGRRGKSSARSEVEDSADERQASKKRGRGPVDEDEESSPGDEGEDAKRVRPVGRGRKQTGASPRNTNKARRTREKGAARRGTGATEPRRNDEAGEFNGPDAEANQAPFGFTKREEAQQGLQDSPGLPPRNAEPGNSRRERAACRSTSNRLGQARGDREELPGTADSDLELDPEGDDESGANTLIIGEDESLSEQQVALLKHICEVLSKAEEYFSFKSALYQLHIKRHLKSCVCSSGGNNAQNSTKAIRLFPFMPAVPINGVEQRALLGLRKRLEAGGSSVLVPGGPGQQIMEEVDELLTSLINKLLLIIVVKYQTCFIHAPARAQLREFLVSFVFPGDPATQMLFRDHVQAVVHARIRHFRDSVGRTLRQNQPTSRRRCFAGDSGGLEGWGAGETEVNVSGRSGASAFSNKSVSPESPRRRVAPALAGRTGENRERLEEEERGSRRRDFGACAADFLPSATAAQAAARNRSRALGTAESFSRRAREDSQNSQLSRLRLENQLSSVPSEDEHLWNAGEFSERRHAVEARDGMVPNPTRRGRRTDGGSVFDEHEWPETHGKSREQLLEHLQQTLLVAAGRNGRDEGLSSLPWDAQRQLEQLLHSAADAPGHLAACGQEDLREWRGSSSGSTFEEENQPAARTRSHQNGQDERNAFGPELAESEELPHIYRASSRSKGGSSHGPNHPRHLFHNFAAESVGAKDARYAVGTRKGRVRDEEVALAGRSARGANKV
ncbi:hypothetical protein TGGT1_311700 [Toxoplasma gondii GT1]|uniref:Uncharacterized protein n=2 Tax=Toxoplasma gondii TaxID=5811 RepID=S7UTM2_TOXGG|nr:hypothetical protein TGGT1_311700 [Toxoplasma gondii GT1]KAF4639335.1 hypothetical protein TGRH88_051070 [Toxoplasma gondii]